MEGNRFLYGLCMGSMVDGSVRREGRYEAGWIKK